MAIRFARLEKEFQVGGLLKAEVKMENQDENNGITYISVVFGDVNAGRPPLLRIINASNNIPNSVTKRIYVMGEKNWQALEQERIHHPRHTWIYCGPETSISADKVKEFGLDKFVANHYGKPTKFGHLLNKIYALYLARRDGCKKTVLIDFDCFPLIPRDQQYYDLINSRSQVFQAPMCYYSANHHTAAWNSGERFIAPWKNNDKTAMANSGWLYIGEDNVVENAMDAMRHGLIHSTMTDEPFLFYGFEKFMGREISFKEYQENHETLVTYLPRYELCDQEVKKKKVNYFVHPFAWLGRGKFTYVDKYFKDYSK